MISYSNNWKADLHLHTYYSDGTESPSEVIIRAAQLCLNVVAITDHDTVRGIAEALEAGNRLGVQVIPGVEITAQFHQQELHLLAYFHPQQKMEQGWHDTRLVKELERYAQCRKRRAQKMVKRLNELGIPLTMEEVCQQTHIESFSIDQKGKSETTLGRPHVAAALLAGRYVSSIDEAFDEFLKKGRPAWVDKECVAAGEIIAVVQKAGGIIILAHPGLLRDENIPAKLLEEGIDGVEVYHSRHNEAQSSYFGHWAKKRGLLITAGSDCHGMLKGEPLMGRVQLSGEDLERFLDKLSLEKEE